MNPRILQLLVFNVKTGRREFHITKCLSRFFEKDPKGGYPKVYDRLEKSDTSTLGKIRTGYQQIVEEFSLLKDEIKELSFMDPTIGLKEYAVDVKWKFHDNPKALKEWVITCDSDYNAGFSTVSLELSPGGKGLFTGYLDTKLPKDGKLKRTGYCNMKSLPPRKAFQREEPFDWGMYTHIVLKVRGDGRSYMLGITTKVSYDLMWHDVYMFPMYTRGGPYWQYVRIPFSKFFMSSKGRIQDKQASIPLHEVRTFGITIADAIPGSYRLEIDYIGLQYDPSHEEEFAYESYRVDPFILV
ncbi:complex I intermediate-associated protein 30, mitochondrial [Cephus cinctus]|uniref:Complex I intermediate-associated protein 30, mitochondrial n=1 Tax=Cephus cinctus TaxID=211228 RepID=A0AAJ7BZ34_CEPCN|nr:complex I intermediate-associated protein 30, mitochondrial [Cephus cinctus]